jgi:acyl-CoA synthetase (AMP-forming)/AMP-acid ligase II
MPSETQSNQNIAARFDEQAKLRPFARAIVFPDSKDRFGNTTWSQLTFRQAHRLCDEYARGLHKMGVGTGHRVSLLVKPCLEFIPLVFAVFKVGAIPVLIDPGMGLDNFLACIERIKPKVLMGEPLAQVLKLVKREPFASVNHTITNGPRTWFWGGVSLPELRVQGDTPFQTVPRGTDDEAAILFTSGSTGPAKGVTYTHGIFQAQTNHIRDIYGIEPGEVDLACFPLFGLFSAAMGMTVVIPDMDPTKPAQADPEKLVEAIETHACTSAFGSPAIWKNLAAWGVKTGLRLPTMKRILMAGAPVPVSLHEQFQTIFDGKAELHTPYGATESLPVASFASHELLAETAALTRQGKGVCVGRVAPDMTVRFIRITDDVLDEWSDDLLVEDGQIGEIVAEGPVVTQEYKDEPGHTTKAKIDKNGRKLHRMGDVGYRDNLGRIWFCGRKSHIVHCPDGTMVFPVPCEALFNEHPDVYRTAVVDVGGKPGVVVELEPGTPKSKRPAVRTALLQIARAHDITNRIDTVWFHSGFPVDVRHNAKLHRPELSAWARSNPPT